MQDGNVGSGGGGCNGQFGTYRVAFGIFYQYRVVGTLINFGSGIFSVWGGYR